MQVSSSWELIDFCLSANNVDRLSGEGTIGTNENVFVNIFATRSYNHLNQVYAAYASRVGKTMESTIRSEFSGDIENLLLDISKWFENTSVTFLGAYSTLDSLEFFNSSIQ